MVSFRASKQSMLIPNDFARLSGLTVGYRLNAAARRAKMKVLTKNALIAMLNFRGKRELACIITRLIEVSFRYQRQLMQAAGCMVCTANTNESNKEGKRRRERGRELEDSEN